MQKSLDFGSIITATQIYRTCNMILQYSLGNAFYCEEILMVSFSSKIKCDRFHHDRIAEWKIQEKMDKLRKY